MIASTHRDATASPGAYRKFFSDSLRLLPARLLPALGSFVVLATATHLLGPAEVGRYGLVLSGVTLLSSLLGSWLDQAVLRLFHSNSHGLTHIALRRAHLGLILGIAGVLAIIGMTAVAVVPAEVRGLVALGVAVLVLSTAFNNAQYLLLAEGRASTFAVFEVARGLLSAGGAIGFLLLGRGAGGLLLAVALSNALLLPFLLWSAELFLRPVINRAAAGYASECVSYGVPLVLWFIGAQILALSDRYILGFFRGPAEVGIYYATYQLIPTAIILVCAPILLAAHPIIMRTAELAPRAEVVAMVHRFTGYYAIFGVLLALEASLNARFISAVLVGPEFEQGWVIVPWLAFGLVAWNLGMFAHKRYEIHRQTGKLVALIAASAVVNLVLNLALVPRFGYLGAAIGTACAYAVYPIVASVAPGPKFSWGIPRGALKAVLAGTGMACGAFFLWTWWSPLSGDILILISSTAVVAAAFVAGIAFVHGRPSRWLNELGE